MFRSLTAVMAISIFGGACAATGVEDELAGDSSADDAIDGKADGAADGVYTYFQVEADLRKCLSPVCGGFFLERLNRTTTVCANGSTKASCYVPELDWSEAGIAEGLQSKLVDAANAIGTTHAIVRGRFASKTYPGFGNMGRFVVTEAWVAESDTTPDGIFAKVVPSGIVCITAPCPSLKEKRLNSSSTANIAEIDWSYADLTDHQIEGFTTEIFSGHGTIISGNRYLNGHAKGRTATAAYHRLVDAPGACFVGGCSSQICSDQEGVISTCEWKPEYACYATATCERQADGACGWTSTPDLDTCLATH